VTEKRSLFSASLALGLAGLLAVTWLAPTHALLPNVAPRVWDDLAASAGGEAEFLVVLAEQADLSYAASILARETRLRYVYDTLRETAHRSQAPLRAELDAAGVSHQSFYIVNAIAMKGDRALVTRLAARSDVDRIVANPRVRQSLPLDSTPPDGMDGVPAGVEWGVARVNADDVWALGHTGEGIVVAGQDTGYDWDHPAIKSQYRGWDGGSPDHDYNWHDAIHSGGGVCGADSLEPCDDQGHGTHTMGTIVGDDGGTNQIGVAPGARWIGCRNMDRGYGTPTTYMECFEFFLAPYPIGGNPSTDGDPTKAPHVINNSWVCPPSEGCDWASLQTSVENVRSAGIEVVASAGNEGSGCSTVLYPIAIYDAAFSVGATDSSDSIAYFSSRGPVTVDGSGRRKPDVTAPGVSVRSCQRGGGYTYKQGTSMSGPHVAGVVALLWSAAPRLIGDVDDTEWIITRTARPRTSSQGCGGDGPSDVPNNVYGWGIVDALAAVKAATIDTEAIFPPSEVPAQTLVYTQTFENAYGFPLTQVVLTDAIPAGTTFAWADGDYVHADGVVTWTVASLASGETLTATLGVTVAHLPRGTNVVNEFYGLRADELPVQIVGTPLAVDVPWRYVLFVFRDWSPEGDGYD
jgi:hypothetical protein